MYIYRFFKKWRKNPKWSFSCCLALLLPLNDLQQEIRGMTGKNVLKQQLQSGNVSMPSVSGALKESGAVSFDLTTIQENTKEASGSPSEETETGSKKEVTTVQGASSTGEEQLKNVHQQKKQTMTGRNKLKQQLQTGNVNMPSVSGAVKESRTMRIVQASIHERPKKKRGSLTKEKKAAEMKERTTDKEAFGQGEETEKNRLPQDNLQLEMRDMKQKQQSGMVNMPSASGTSKTSGAVSYVIVTIHEHAKEASGSSQERAAVGMKQGNDNQVAANTNEEQGNRSKTPEEELEETHL